MLQRKRDRMAVLNNLSFINSDQKSITDKDDATFELRTNIKSGFGLDFYNTKSTEISGWLTIVSVNVFLTLTKYLYISLNRVNYYHFIFIAKLPI